MDDYARATKEKCVEWWAQNVQSVVDAELARIEACANVVFDFDTSTNVAFATSCFPAIRWCEDIQLSIAHIAAVSEILDDVKNLPALVDTYNVNIGKKIDWMHTTIKNARDVVAKTHHDYSAVHVLLVASDSSKLLFHDTPELHRECGTSEAWRARIDNEKAVIMHELAIQRNKAERFVRGVRTYIKRAKAEFEGGANGGMHN